MKWQELSSGCHQNTYYCIKHQAKSKRGYQVRFVTGTNACITNSQPIKKQKIAGEHLEEDFPFLKLLLSDLCILQPNQRKHSETLRAALKVPHQKSPLPSDLLGPAHGSQWPSWPQAPPLWLVMPWVTTTWQPQMCFLRPWKAFFCRSGARWSRPTRSGRSSSEGSRCPRTHREPCWPTLLSPGSQLSSLSSWSGQTLRTKQLQRAVPLLYTARTRSRVAARTRV